MKHVAVFVAVISALALWPADSHAAASCSVLRSSGGTLADFGTFSILTRHRDVPSQITLVCDGPAVPFALSIGTGSSGTFGSRTLSFAGNTLAYNLYVDAAHSKVFGDGTASTNKAIGICAATCEVFVHGRLFGGQVVPPGTYTDDVLVTLEFF